MSLDPGTLLTLLAKGTPGPWKVCGIGDDTPESEWVTIRAQIGGALVTTTEWSADAALIAAAVNVLPELLDHIAALEAENARLRGSIKHAHGCLLDAGVTMPGDPLAGVSDGIRALEAENAALRVVEKWARYMQEPPRSADPAVCDALDALDALRKEGE